MRAAMRPRLTKPERATHRMARIGKAMHDRPEFRRGNPFKTVQIFSEITEADTRK